MLVENNPDFKTIWQLAHNWAGEETDKTDPNAISPELRLAIDRLMRAIRSKKITARWKGYQIFIDNLLLTLIFEFSHFKQFYQWLMHHKFSKDYLDNLYVMRNEVIDLCIKSYYNLPPCWVPEQFSYDSKNAKEAKNHRPADENEDRIRCQAIASTLWELDPAIHPNHIARSKILQRIGNGAQYDISTITDWITERDPQKDYRKTGRPPKTQYTIKLEMIPQSKK